MVDAELKIDVNEEIRAANITASIMPRKPIQLYWIRNIDSGILNCIVFWECLREKRQWNEMSLTVGQNSKHK